MTVPIDGLAAGLDRDERHTVAEWARDHSTLNTAGYSVLAATVSELLERHQAEIDETGSTRLLPIEERALLEGIVRLRRLASAGGDVEEHAETSLWSYGVLVRDGHGAIALGVASSRPTIVAAAAPTAPWEHVVVVRALAKVTNDMWKIDRDFSLTPGRVCSVDPTAVGASAPKLASRWAVATGGVLRPWLDSAGVVAVTPAGGRLAYAAKIANFEHNVRGLASSIKIRGELAADLEIENWRSYCRRVERLRGWLDELEALCWTPEIEPLSTADGASFIAALRAHPTDASAVLESLGYRAPLSSPR